MRMNEDGAWKLEINADIIEKLVNYLTIMNPLAHETRSRSKCRAKRDGRQS